MSEELLSNDRRVEKIFTMLQPTFYWQQAFLRSESNRGHSKMKNESAKRSLEKPKNVLEEKRKVVKRKICIKKTFVQKQLRT